MFRDENKMFTPQKKRYQTKEVTASLVASALKPSQDEAGAEKGKQTTISNKETTREIDTENTDTESKDE